MSKIVCWDYGHGSSAELAASAAICTALMFAGRVLLVNEESAGKGVEAGVGSRSGSRYAGGSTDSASPVAESGMDALLRLAANQRLSKGNFQDYTYPAIAGKLDLVPGFSPEGRQEREIAERNGSLSLLYSVAEEAYDSVFTRSDASELREPERAPYREGKEMHFPVLRQNRLELERFFEEYRERNREITFADGILLHHYDPASHWTAGNIKRRFGCKLPIYGIPYSTEFMDAWNNGNILKHIRLSSLIHRKGKPKDGPLDGLSKFCLGLYEMAGRKPGLLRSEKGA
ncbi:hypothetical protein V3851_15625 [Paenibacillus sp. M1]|uniref:Uncharacterized protein n=1 Tax=Paenibacillus haidiansis TaxID=1574488 RepID=A0ABU7VU29_9BACL